MTVFSWRYSKVLNFKVFEVRVLFCFSSGSKILKKNYTVGNIKKSWTGLRIEIAQRGRCPDSMFAIWGLYLNWGVCPRAFSAA